MKTSYQNQVLLQMAAEKVGSPEILTEKDLEHLPELVKKYIRFTGFVGKEKTKNFYLKATGQIRADHKADWMQFTSEQYNYFKSPFRAFYISAKKWGIPVTGLHLYKDETASMVIKILELFKVVDAKGPEMNQGETVTVLNDMCFMAPGSLINSNIQWEEINKNQVKAIYTNGKITVSALLTFGNDGRLVNFLSYDRFETSDGKKYLNLPWETPVRQYADFGGFHLPSKADVIYKRPEGDFCYLVFNLVEIKYNVSQLQ